MSILFVLPAKLMFWGALMLVAGTLAKGFDIEHQYTTLLTIGQSLGGILAFFGLGIAVRVWLEAWKRR